MQKSKGVKTAGLGFTRVFVVVCFTALSTLSLDRFLRHRWYMLMMCALVVLVRIVLYDWQCAPWFVASLRHYVNYILRQI
jgi:hypothetical protein